MAEEKNEKDEKKETPVKKVWMVKKKIVEGTKVFMPGDVYSGIQTGLGPKHPWVKAKWLVETVVPEKK